MAKKATPTTFKWSSDPAARTGELIAAKAKIEEMIVDSIREAAKDGHGRTSLARAAGVPSSTMYHAMIRAGVLAKPGEKPAKTARPAKVVAKVTKITKPTTKSKGRKTAAAAKTTGRKTKSAAK